ncbi:hypothetical protein JCM17823_07610 [Halorubrum gandharaense]
MVVRLDPMCERLSRLRPARPDRGSLRDRIDAAATQRERAEPAQAESEAIPERLRARGSAMADADDNTPAATDGFGAEHPGNKRLREWWTDRLPATTKSKVLIPPAFHSNCARVV